MISTKEAQAPTPDLVGILSQTIGERILPPHLELVPQINELYELELALYESQILTDEEIVRNAGYFARAGDAFTRHFLMCSGEPVRLPRHSSSRLRSFFRSNQFKTGYATHGLFPYRGKFHPQMIKGLLNAIGLKLGQTVVDPMMGSPMTYAFVFDDGAYCAESWPINLHIVFSRHYERSLASRERLAGGGLTSYR